VEEVNPSRTIILSFFGAMMESTRHFIVKDGKALKSFLKD